MLTSMRVQSSHLRVLGTEFRVQRSGYAVVPKVDQGFTGTRRTQVPMHGQRFPFTRHAFSCPRECYAQVFPVSCDAPHKLTLRYTAAAASARLREFSAQRRRITAFGESESEYHDKTARHLPWRLCTTQYSSVLPPCRVSWNYLEGVTLPAIRLCHTYFVVSWRSIKAVS